HLGQRARGPAFGGDRRAGAHPLAHQPREVHGALQAVPGAAGADVAHGRAGRPRAIRPAAVSSSEEAKPAPLDAGLGETEKEKKEKKRLRKLQRALEDASRPLGAWERYRALTDAFQMEQDLVDLADHKARFALLIMYTLNAVTFIIGTRSEALSLVPHSLRASLGLYIGLYSLLALYFFIQAIESLRPREAKPNVKYPGAVGLEDYPLGVRFFTDVLARDVNAYRSVWRSIHVGQLN